MAKVVRSTADRCRGCRARQTATKTRRLRSDRYARVRKTPLVTGTLQSGELLKPGRLSRGARALSPRVGVDEIIGHTVAAAQVFTILLELDLAGRLERHADGGGFADYDRPLTSGNDADAPFLPTAQTWTCPDAVSAVPAPEKVGNGVLRGYRLCFPRLSDRRGCGVASVEPSEGQEVWGVVYDLTAVDLASLDGLRAIAPTAQRKTTATTAWRLLSRSMACRPMWKSMSLLPRRSRRRRVRPTSRTFATAPDTTAFPRSIAPFWPAWPDAPSRGGCCFQYVARSPFRASKPDRGLTARQSAAM